MLGFTNVQPNLRPYPPSRWQPGETKATARMEFMLRGAAPVEVGYDMHWSENAWKIYDVHVLGLSSVGIYRENFANEIRRHGLDGLVGVAALDELGVSGIGHVGDLADAEFLERLVDVLRPGGGFLLCAQRSLRFWQGEC